MNEGRHHLPPKMEAGGWGPSGSFTPTCLQSTSRRPTPPCPVQLNQSRSPAACALSLEFLPAPHFPTQQGKSGRSVVYWSL